MRGGEQEVERLQEIEQRLAIARRVGDDEDGPNWYAHDVGWLLPRLQESYRAMKALARDISRQAEEIARLKVLLRRAVMCTRVEWELVSREIEAVLRGEQP